MNYEHIYLKRLINRYFIVLLFKFMVFDWINKELIEEEANSDNFYNILNSNIFC